MPKFSIIIPVYNVEEYIGSCLESVKNQTFKDSINETLHYTDDPIVSSDIISSTCGATVDGNLTNIIEVDNNQLVHIVAWYDDEMGYSYQMVRTLAKM